MRVCANCVGLETLCRPDDASLAVVKAVLAAAGEVGLNIQVHARTRTHTHCTNVHDHTNTLAVVKAVLAAAGEVGLNIQAYAHTLYKITRPHKYASCGQGCTGSSWRGRFKYTSTHTYTLYKRTRPHKHLQTYTHLRTNECTS